ncbi:MAG: helix-turn-helix transcriptional regulator [Bacilli bacterium]|nr:helix-turn-helix transcriptional regulator [Bacilli bacterium]
MSLKDAKVNFLVDMATDLFMSRSIQEVTIRDIAIAAQVGEATIYRYFGKKQTLVVQAAMKLQQAVNTDYFKLEQGKNGFEKIKIFYLSYLEIFNAHPEFFKFINDFDVFMSDDDSDAISPYELVVGQYEKAFMKAYEQGLKDGSVKKQNDITIFYFSTTHALLELCKKLSIRKAVLTQDNVIEKKTQIECLIDIILSALKN